MAWNNIAAKAGYGAKDKSTGRKTLHLHMMRKLFRSQLALKVPVDVVEALMGHSAYLSEAYRRYTKKQVREMYAKGSSILHVFGDADISDVKEQLDSTSKILEATRVDGQQTAKAQSMLVIENTQLKTQLEAMRDEITHIQTEITRFNDLIFWIQGTEEYQKHLKQGTPQQKVSKYPKLKTL